MMNPQISIIIPVYNVEKYIEKCLESVKQQTFDNFECILIDDGSTDHSGDICDLYAKADERFYVFHQNNAGVGAARNYGIKVARGEYIVFADPDDFLAEDYFENVVSSIPDFDMVIYNATYLFRSYEKTIVLNDAEELFFEGDDVKEVGKYVLDRDIPNINIPFIGTPWMKVYRKQKLVNDDLKFIEGIHPLEDLIFNLCYVQKCKNIKFVNKSFYYYRIHEESATLGIKKNRYENFLLAQRELLDRFQDSREMIDIIYKWSVGQLWFCLSRQTFNKQCFTKYKEKKQDFLMHINDIHIISTLQNVKKNNISLEKRFMIFLYEKKCFWGLYLMCKVFNVCKRL